MKRTLAFAAALVSTLILARAPAQTLAPSASIAPRASTSIAASTSAPVASASVLAKASTTLTTSASAPASASPPPSSMPPGHPPLGNEAGMPPGHPPLDDEAGMPPGHPMVDDANDVDVDENGQPKIPPDQSSDDPALPKGTLSITILDALDRPVPDVEITLDVTRQSVAQGDSKSVELLRTDASGNVELHDRSTGTGWIYRVSVKNAAVEDSSKVATFSVEPFQLPLDRGHRVFIHRYPVSGVLDRNMLVVVGVDAQIEVHDDAVFVSEQIQFVNFGRVAWALGSGLTLSLPPNAKAVHGGETNEDVKIEGIEGVGAKLSGSIRPGGIEHSINAAFDFQIPYDGEANLDFTLGLVKERTASASVVVAARRGMTLSVDGFAPSKLDMGNNGIHVLHTAKSMQEIDPQHPLESITIHIGGLPSQGSSKWVFTGLGLLAVAVGIFLGLKKPAVDPERLAEARGRARADALAELVALERAHRDELVGPIAYERERAKLIDQLADLVDDASDASFSSRDSAGAAIPAKKKKRRSAARAR